MAERTDVLVGRTDDGDRFTVDVRLEFEEGEHMTVAHKTVRRPLCLAFQGQVYGKRHREPWAFGQVDSELSLITEPAQGWTMESIRDLQATWQRWHLNVMHAGCAHQEVVWEDTPYRRPSLTLTKPCPITGYRYGTAWLVDPLPGEVAAKAQVFIGGQRWFA